MARELNARQEAFAKAVVLNGGDKVKARETAGYSMRMSKAAQTVDGNDLFNHPIISLRIAELQKKADKVAEDDYGVSVAWRVKMAKRIIEAGLGTYSDQHGNQRYEGLGAADKSINTLNAMLGTKEGDENTESMEITFNVVDARLNA